MTSLIRRDTSGSIYLILYLGIISWITRFGVAADGTCGRPGRTAISVHDPGGDSFREGDKVRYRCSTPGDEILGDTERMCQKNGSWSGDIPVCYKRTLIEEASLENEDPKTETSFSIDGNTSTCTSHSMYNHTVWEGTVSTSVNISAVRIVLEGKRGMDIDVEIKGENLRGVKCKNDSEKIGTISSERVKIITFFCPAGTVAKQVRITFNHVLRICEVYIFRLEAQQCLTPDIPANAVGLKISSGKRSEYKFTCNAGYKLWGNVATSCQEDGTWYPRSPTCEKIFCDAPSQPKNGKAEYNLLRGRVPYMGSATYSCNDGFYLEGSSRLLCIRWNKWDSPVPECKAISREISITSKASFCGRLPLVGNGHLTIDTVGPGLTAVLKCHEGFKPRTVDRISCMDTGEWSSQPSCTIIKCEDNPFVPHGSAILLENSSYYGAHLKIECSQGHNSDETIIRRCEESGSWGDLNVCEEITCGSLLSNETNGGKWISLNDSHSMRILVCPEGFHIEGSPPVTQCLPNGTWSYTSAKCKNSVEDGYWRNSLSPSLMLIAAVAVGALTALFILCLAVAFLVVRKRRQSRTNTTVFHLGDTLETDTSSVPNFLNLKHHSTTGCYNDAIELRPKSTCRNPRKPRSALPNLPLDADPVYAQPFETATATKKISATAVNKKDDLYNAHIYAEPVDSRISSADSNNVSINVSVCRVGVNPGTATIKANLRNESSTSGTNPLNCDKTCAIYDSSGNTSSLSTGNLAFAVDEKYQSSNERAALETLIDNAQYLEFV